MVTDCGPSTRESNGGANWWPEAWPSWFQGWHQTHLRGQKQQRPCYLTSEAAPGVWKASGPSMASIGNSGYNLIRTEGN